MTDSDTRKKEFIKYDDKWILWWRIFFKIRNTNPSFGYPKNIWPSSINEAYSWEDEEEKGLEVVLARRFRNRSRPRRMFLVADGRVEVASGVGVVVGFLLPRFKLNRVRPRLPNNRERVEVGGGLVEVVEGLNGNMIWGSVIVYRLFLNVDMLLGILF